MSPVVTASGNEAPVLCGICGGECCRTKPGIEGPERFLTAGDPAEALYQALASGRWVLAEHYGVPRAEGIEAAPGDMDRLLHYPRPATRREREPDLLLPEEEGNCCAFLGDSGCRLSFAGRPRMCRELEPDANFECTAAWTRRDAALAWLPWQQMVEEALRRLTGAAARQTEP
jgi:hypothetical protein